MACGAMKTWNSCRYYLIEFHLQKTLKCINLFKILIVNEIGATQDILTTLTIRMLGLVMELGRDAVFLFSKTSFNKYDIVLKML